MTGGDVFCKVGMCGFWGFKGGEYVPMVESVLQLGCGMLDDGDGKNVGRRFVFYIVEDGINM